LEERFVNNILNPVIFIKVRDNYKNPTLPTSTRLVTMTIPAEFSCQIILQKSLTVSCMGPTGERGTHLEDHAILTKQLEIRWIHRQSLRERASQTSINAHISAC